MDDLKNTDPKTAPKVPIEVIIDWDALREPEWHITVSMYDRQTDKKAIYHFQAFKAGPFEVTELDSDDREWLKNIGALA